VGLALLVGIATAATAQAGDTAPTDEALVAGFRWALAGGAALSALAALLVLAVSGCRSPAPARRPDRAWRTTRSRGRASR
jgi:hypothetical protein